MNLEYLELRSERLNKNKQKTERQEQARAKWQEKADGRRARRIVPYQELADRNKKLFERSRVISEAGSAYGNLVALGQLGTGSSRNNLVVLTQATVTSTELLEYSGPALKGVPKVAEFTFYGVDDSLLERVQAEPHLDSAMTGADHLDFQRTYGVGKDRIGTSKEAQDEILTLGDWRNHGLPSIVCPINAISRARDARIITAHLSEIESTVSQIEEAAHNPELNPVLSRVLTEGEQSRQPVA